MKTLRERATAWVSGLWSSTVGQEVRTLGIVAAIFLLFFAVRWVAGQVQLRRAHQVAIATIATQQQSIADKDRENRTLREKVRAYESSEEYAEIRHPDGTIEIYRRSNVHLLEEEHEEAAETARAVVPVVPPPPEIPPGLGAAPPLAAGEQDRLPWTLGPGYSVGGWAVMAGYELALPIAPGWAAWLTPSATWGPRAGFEAWLPLQLGRRGRPTTPAR